jgi:hypothetical protein
MTASMSGVVRTCLALLWAAGLGTAGRDVAQSGPGPRNAHGLAYDLAAGSLVLFGGATATEVRGDTWLWHDGVWHEALVRGPSPRTFPAMAYDSARAEVILFGGNRVLFGGRHLRPGSVTRLGDTWEWDGGRWSRVSTAGPPRGVGP